MELEKIEDIIKKFIDLINENREEDEKIRISKAELRYSLLLLLNKEEIEKERYTDFLYNDDGEDVNES